MNVEAWQAQQKAQKDAEKQRKIQAAEALRTYKGDAANAETVKFAQLKEQDRLKKLEAERQLHQYRGTVSDEDTKLSAYKEEERRKKQEAANMLRGYQGTLSEDELKLAAIREEERRKKQEMQQKLYDSLQTTQVDGMVENGSITPGSVSAMANVFDAPAPLLEDKAPAPAGTLPHHTPSLNDAESETPETESQPTPMADLDVPKTKTAMARFMFCVVSVGDHSPIEGYLKTIDRLVTDTIGEDTRNELNFQYPKILTVENDANFVQPAGRQGLVRKSVTVGVPFEPRDQVSGQVLRNRIVEAVRTRIQNGTFRKEI